MPTWRLVAAPAAAAVIALAGCTHSGHLPNAPAGAPLTSSAEGAAQPGSSSSSSPGPAAVTGASASPKPGATSTSNRPGPRGSSSRPPAVLAAPVGSNLSGVICNYVRRSDVDRILSGASSGQENDLQSTAISYCAFNNSSGTVTVGVKNLAAASAATAEVRAKYDETAGYPDQSLQTFQAAGQFAFQVGTTTPLKNGVDLYAMGAQGSRGGWYATIQYYAHVPCGPSAMQRLLDAVLSRVPTTP